MRVLEFVQKLKGVKEGKDGQYQARCPAHDDKVASLSVREADDGKILLNCHAGCTAEKIVSAMGLTMTDLYPNEQKKTLVATYKYFSADEKTLLAEKKRFSNKSFYWEGKMPDGTIDYHKPHDCPVYNLSVLMNSNCVYLVEGEKDVDTLTALGIPATCSPDGAGNGKWKAEYTSYFTGKEIVIIQDNDDAGKEFAQQEAAALYPVSKSVKVIDLCILWTDMPEHADITDYVHYNDKAILDVQCLVKKTCPWKPDKSSTESSIEFSMADLVQENLLPVQFIVDGLLPFGLTILTSAPKIGKSWMVLDLCFLVTTGAPFLGRRTTQCDTLYLALEDSKTRLSERVKKIAQGKPIPNGFYCNIESSNLNDGLFDELTNAIQRHPNIKLIVIDTLQKIRGRVGHRENAYASDYNDLGALQKFAASKCICLLLVHHLRKMPDATDSFNRISGSNGVFGAVDTAITLSREKRSDEETVLSVTGRDVDAVEEIIKFDKDICRWTTIGNVNAIDERLKKRKYQCNSLVMTIQNLVKENGGTWKGFIKDISAAAEHMQAVGCSIGTPKQIAVDIKKLENDLYKYDEIVHTIAKNGNAGARHTFKKANSNGLTEETEVAEVSHVNNDDGGVYE